METSYKTTKAERDYRKERYRVEGERERAYAKAYYKRNREKRLEQMKAYNRRRKLEREIAQKVEVENE